MVSHGIVSTQSIEFEFVKPSPCAHAHNGEVKHKPVYQAAGIHMQGYPNSVLQSNKPFRVLTATTCLIFPNLALYTTPNSPRYLKTILHSHDRPCSVI